MLYDCKGYFCVRLDGLLFFCDKYLIFIFFKFWEKDFILFLWCGNIESRMFDGLLFVVVVLVLFVYIYFFSINMSVFGEEIKLLGV